MKKYSIIFLCLLPLVGFSQSEPGAGWKVGVVVLQDFYKSAESTKDNYSGYFLEPADFNYTTGLTAQFALGSRTEFLTGFTYSKKDFTSTFYCHVCDFSRLPQPEPIRLRYLEIPLLIRYNFLDKKLGLYADAGLLSGYRVSESDSDTDEVMFGSNYLLSGQVGLGASYAIGPRIGLNLNAVYRKTLEDFSKDTNLELNSIGVGAGFAFKLK